MALSDLGKYEDAIELYNIALKIDPNYEYSWLNKGLALEKLKQYKNAVASYDQVLNIDPKNQRALSYKARTLKSLNNYEMAVECYERIIELNKENKRNNRRYFTPNELLAIDIFSRKHEHEEEPSGFIRMAPYQIIIRPNSVGHSISVICDVCAEKIDDPAKFMKVLTDYNSW